MLTVQTFQAMTLASLETYLRKCKRDNYIYFEEVGKKPDIGMVQTL